MAANNIPLTPGLSRVGEAATKRNGFNRFLKPWGQHTSA